jgi:integrase
MAKRALTVAAIDRLKAPAKGQTDHFDAGYPGLACRISCGGTKSFVYVYRAYGKQRRLTLGRHPAMTLAEAREAWRNAREAIAASEDPAANKPVNDFEAVADEWLKRDQAHNRSRAEVERVLSHDLKPAFRGRLITDIRRRDCLNVIDAIADRGAMTMARRAHAYLHRLMKWSVGRGIIAANPMENLPKPGKEVSRDRVLTDDELRAVWNAAVALGWPFGPAVQLLILTGARVSEISNLKRRELKESEIILELTKNGKPHIIPLSEMAKEIFDALPNIDGALIFSTTGKTPISGWSRAKTQIDKRLPSDFPEWRIHDLRRTVATGMQRLGVGLQVVENVLGHTSGSRGGIVGVYQRHDYADEKRRALNMWSAHVDSVLSDERENAIIPLFTKM